MAEQLREFVTAQFSSFISVSVSTFIRTAWPGVGGGGMTEGLERVKGGERGIRGGDREGRGMMQWVQGC